MNRIAIAKELVRLARELTAGKEYVIWGIPKDGTSDTLLLGTVEGKPITDLGDARKYVKLLANKYGAKRLRIQTIDLEGEFDWLKETGLKG